MSVTLPTYNLLILSRLKPFRNKRKFNELRKVIKGDFSDLNQILNIIQHLNIVEKNEIDTAKSDADQVLIKNEKHNAKLISYYDNFYPGILQLIDDAPLLLTYKGDIGYLSNNISFSIIGTRKPTEYGFNAGLRVSQFFSKVGVNIVSGLAEGCDTAAHLGAVKNEKPTTAILGTPIDKVYPKQNKGLASDILDSGGCILTEYIFGDHVFPSNFIDRDRIQAGLSFLTILVESALKGGAMHTINFAMNYDRLIAAISHPVAYRTEKSDGNFSLIEEGVASKLGDTRDLFILFERLMNECSNNNYYFPVLPDYVDSFEKIIYNISNYFNEYRNEYNF